MITHQPQHMSILRTFLVSPLFQFFLPKFSEKLKKIDFNKLTIISLFWLLSEFHFKFSSQIS
jgi:hypothetical protein